MRFIVEPEAPRSNWSAISGLLLCISWAPMAIAIPRLPDLDSMAEVNRFWEDNFALMQAVIASVSVGFMFLLVFLGWLAEWLRRAGGALAFTVFGSAVMFADCSQRRPRLGYRGGTPAAGRIRAELVRAALRRVSPCRAGRTRGDGVLRRARLRVVRKAPSRGRSGWLAVIGAIANIGALAGVVSLDGPLNSGNGVVGGIAAPLGLFLAWILSVQRPGGSCRKEERGLCPRGIAGPGAPGMRRPIRVVSWNLRWRFGPWRERAEAIRSVLVDARPDICGLQEVWADGERNFASELAEELEAAVGLGWFAGA